LVAAAAAEELASSEGNFHGDGRSRRKRGRARGWGRHRSRSRGREWGWGGRAAAALEKRAERGGQKNNKRVEMAARTRGAP